MHLLHLVYHHIIYMCDFLMNLDAFFAMICTDFYEVVVSTIYVPLLMTVTNDLCICFIWAHSQSW